MVSSFLLSPILDGPKFWMAIRMMRGSNSFTLLGRRLASSGKTPSTSRRYWMNSRNSMNSKSPLPSRSTLRNDRSNTSMDTCFSRRLMAALTSFWLSLPDPSKSSAWKTWRRSQNCASVKPAHKAYSISRSHRRLRARSSMRPARDWNSAKSMKPLWSKSTARIMLANSCCSLRLRGCKPKSARSTPISEVESAPLPSRSYRLNASRNSSCCRPVLCFRMRWPIVTNTSNVMFASWPSLSFSMSLMA
mmetsp:Transcript_44711/g.130152  ORF Transcript_44711/g.130152 Transcript_44711/m.130152 type:complete len:247 (+) Transcript_44711:331-1071(+)